MYLYLFQETVTPSIMGFLLPLEIIQLYSHFVKHTSSIINCFIATLLKIVGTCFQSFPLLATVQQIFVIMMLQKNVSNEKCLIAGRE